MATILYNLTGTGVSVSFQLKQNQVPTRILEPGFIVYDLVPGSLNRIGRTFTIALFSPSVGGGYTVSSGSSFIPIFLNQGNTSTIFYTGLNSSPSLVLGAINTLDDGGAQFSVPMTNIMTLASTPTVSTISPGVFYGNTLAAAFANSNNLDLIQVVNEGGNVVWTLTASGVSIVNPVSPTTEALISRFLGSSFATAFTNPLNQDILQIVNQGNGVIFHVDHTGQASFT